MRSKRLKRALRQLKIKNKIGLTSSLPRLVVFRSNKHIYAQLIDRPTGHTLAGSSDLSLRSKDNKQSVNKQTKADKAFQVGQDLAKKAATQKIKRVIFDRSGYKYHGRVKAVAEGAKGGGLNL